MSSSFICYVLVYHQLRIWNIFSLATSVSKNKKSPHSS
ncbi:hypothetical protein HS5302_1302 [Enterococcus faecalis]|nr:hypothetical protein HS5302_1302 [Enterococcus faecalis]